MMIVSSLPVRVTDVSSVHVLALLSCEPFVDVYSTSQKRSAAVPVSTLADVLVVATVWGDAPLTVTAPESYSRPSDPTVSPGVVALQLAELS
jgi:hypothetical protein